ncbi:hypothetical protein BDV32DRAFT_136177 [Aspergillus pseudonomiae]|nr:hypothetical protein BDV32DRAFT_136177 [Aspergillus pseudonomiae]
MDVERWLEQLPATGPILSSDNTSLVDMAAQADTRETTISTSAPRRSCPTKRQRTDYYNSEQRMSPSPSLVSLSECTEPRSRMSIASRQGSPTRDVFNQLRLAKPAIICEPQATGPIPGTISSLRKRLADWFGQGIIPKGLESRIRESAYFDSGHMSDAALDVLWNELEEIRLEARHYVVQPILRKPTQGSSKLQLTSVQSQQIDGDLLPMVTNNLTRINQKADYALSFSCRDPEVSSLYERVSLGGHGYAISQTTDAFNKRTIVFSGVELAIWLSGNLEKMRRLGELAKGPLDQADWLLPTIGYTVVGHDWYVYIAYRLGNEVHVVGPISSVRADTRSTYGILKLRDLDSRVRQYALDVYWLWVRDEILQPLAMQRLSERLGHGKAAVYRCVE